MAIERKHIRSLVRVRGEAIVHRCASYYEGMYRGQSHMAAQNNAERMAK